MHDVALLKFDQTDILEQVDVLEDGEYDSLDFGAIGFDADYVVRRYNRYESEMAGLTPQRVLGQGIFTAVAVCMNNFLVAQRFEDAAAAGTTLDATIDYVLTLRMRPTKVKLRLLASPKGRLRYVLIDRRK